MFKSIFLLCTFCTLTGAEGIWYDPSDPYDPFGDKERQANEVRERLDGTYRGINWPFEGISVPIRKPTQEEIDETLEYYRNRDFDVEYIDGELTWFV